MQSQVVSKNIPESQWVLTSISLKWNNEVKFPANVSSYNKFWHIQLEEMAVVHAYK